MNALETGPTAVLLCPLGPSQAGMREVEERLVLRAHGALPTAESALLKPFLSAEATP